VQTLDNEVLEKIERGHSVKETIEATRTLKDLGFKINYHMMLGLPGSDEKKDLDSFKKLFYDEDFRPDMLKIYPCMVMQGTKLYSEWRKGRYSPLTTERAARLIARIKSIVPEYVRIMRVQRDIPTEVTSAGVDRTNLRQYVENVMKEQGISCRCIRCREIGRKSSKGRTKIKILEYAASNGKEFFIALEKVDSLVGFCRLRFPSRQLRREITKDSCLVRELHIYGETAQIGKKGKIQHKGYGKDLLRTAEEIAGKNRKKKIVVISGVGARQYYRKLGYRKEGPYMVKTL
jgi:elongator complex protein 3